MPQSVIIGGGMAGLGTALALARDGHRVTVLERDAMPLPATPVEAFERWDRRGAPQVRHSHAFLARLRNLLRDRAPDVLEALVAAGAEELRFADLMPPTFPDRSPRPGDDELVMLACRRITFEWVLRRRVADEPGVRFRDGVRVEGLAGELTGGVPHVRGVHFRAGDDPEETLEADWVIDASGRRSKLPAWLEAMGGRRPVEESEDCGIFYCSRFYRLRDGGRRPERDTTIGADLGYLKYAIFHGDAGIFSITFAASPEDEPLRALLQTGPFEAAARALPATRAWADPAVSEPVTDVHAMASLRNVRRDYVDDAGPLALGVLAVGDASIHTNPLYGRGCSFALVHAFLLADVLREHGDDADAAARAFHECTAREIGPWYEMARSQDRDALEVARLYAEGRAPDERADGGDGAPVDPKAYMRSLLRHGLLPLLRTDPDVSRAFFRSFNLLTPPADLMREPAVMMKVLDAYQHRAEREEPDLGPDRAGMLQTLLDAA